MQTSALDEPSSEVAWLAGKLPLAPPPLRAQGRTPPRLRGHSRSPIESSVLFVDEIQENAGIMMKRGQMGANAPLIVAFKLVGCARTFRGAARILPRIHLCERPTHLEVSDRSIVASYKSKSVSAGLA